MCQKAGIFEILSSTHRVETGGFGLPISSQFETGVVGASKNNYVTGEEDIEGICDLSGKFIIYFLTFNMLVRQK